MATIQKKLLFVLVLLACVPASIAQVNLKKVSGGIPQKMRGTYALNSCENPMMWVKIGQYSAEYYDTDPRSPNNKIKPWSVHRFTNIMGSNGVIMSYSPPESNKVKHLPGNKILVDSGQIYTLSFMNDGGLFVTTEPPNKKPPHNPCTFHYYICEPKEKEFTFQFRRKPLRRGSLGDV